MRPSGKHALALVVLVGALIAGCTATPDDADRANQPTKPLALNFTPPGVVIDLRNVQSEAFIEVTPDASTRLTCLHGEFKEPSIMLVTEDSGRTWKELQATPTPGVGGDCEVALTGESGWHFVHTQAVGIVVASTFDGGASWRVNHLAGPPVATFSDRPWLEAVGDSLVLSYAGYAGIQTRVSPDEGETWSVPQVPIQPAPGHLALPGHLKIGPDGQTVAQPYMHVSATGPGEGADEVTPGVAVSIDLGQTWVDHRLEPTSGLRLHPATAVAPDGSIHLTYYETRGAGAHLVARTSSDQGATWSEPWTVAEDLGRVSRVWADTRPDGLLDIMYMAETADDGFNGTAWNVTFLRTNPSLNEVLARPYTVQVPRVNEFVSFTHDEAGLAYAVFTEVRGGSLTSPPEDGSVLWTVAEEPGPAT